MDWCLTLRTFFWSSRKSQHGPGRRVNPDTASTVDFSPPSVTEQDRMAVNANVKVNGLPLSDPRFEPYIDKNGVFSWKGVIIKPSGSVRVGETKIHPSGLIQVGDKVHIEGVVAPKQFPTSKPATSQSVSLRKICALTSADLL